MKKKKKNQSRRKPLTKQQKGLTKKTVEEFIAIVENENKKHNERLLNMSPETLIASAYEIAKWQAIYDYMKGKVIPYLEDREEVFEEFLTLKINNPITSIYMYELGYDEAQWTDWNNLDDVVRKMFRAIKNQNN